MTEGPYRLARDVRGNRFRDSGAIAAKLGMEKVAPSSYKPISFALQTATDQGPPCQFRCLPIRAENSWKWMPH